MRVRWIGMAALAAAAASAQAPTTPEAPGSFCERLAGQTGMTPEHAKAGERPRLWSTRALNLAQRFLVGGQAVVTMQMATAGNASAADYARLIEACKPVGKNLACAIEGPAELRLGINGKEARTVAETGEKARVEMVGSRITCRDD